ncbi:MAG: serpin family protein [Anaerolineae bacterium]|jgi:serpin B
MQASTNRILAALILVALLGSMAAGCARDEEPTQAVQPEATQAPDVSQEQEPMKDEKTGATPTPDVSQEQDQPQAQGPQVASSKVQRAMTPSVSPADLADLVDGNSAFAFDLYQALRGQKGNLFYSPYSISLALAMTYAGARGETARQMAETLRFGLAQERLHPAFNALDLKLTGPHTEGFELNIANSLWGQHDYVFLSAFLDTLAENYGAGLRLLDFVNAPEPSRQVINDWISQQTEEKIQDLIPAGGITPVTVLVLANAIYFNAEWLHPFAEDRTHDAPFYTLDGKQVTVPMMAMSEPQTLSYARGQGYKAVEMLYKGQEMSMLVVVPDEGQFEAFEAALDAAQVETIVSALAPNKVILRMPKFTYESEFGLAETLAGMGMPDAFGKADFSGMDGTQNLFISDVFHKAFVAVDEAGTEAAAATAVVMSRLSLPEYDVELTVDRPFVFMIRDVETGAILFVGRVVNPV